jgi:hypothetical protein
MVEKNILIIAIIVVIILFYIFSNKLSNNLSNNSSNNSSNHLFNINKNMLINFIQFNCVKNGNKLFIIPHLELGDNLILNGAIRFLSTKYKKIIYVVKQIYYDQISIMFSDIPNLLLYPTMGGFIENRKMSTLIPYDNDVKNIYNKYNIDFIVFDGYRNEYDLTNYKYPRKYPVYFYDDLRISHDIRYTYFKINRNYNNENILYYNLINIIGNNYIIILDDEKRNLIINKKYYSNKNIPIFKLNNNSNNEIKELNNIRTSNIFNYIKILENAKEIHSIDSSILLLIDQLNINVKTYVHRYARNQPLGYVVYRNKNFIYIDK